MLNAIDTLMQGILLGGRYALMAVGLSLAFGVMRLVNVAHGDFIVLAAYLTLIATTRLAWHPLLCILLVVPVMAAVGYGLQRSVLNRVVGKDIMPGLLVTFGFSVIIQNGLLETFSADSQRLQAADLVSASFPLADRLSIGWFPLMTFVLAIVTIASFELFMQRTPLGRAFRAVSDDPEVAELMGYDNRHIYALAMAIAFAAIGLSGVLFGIGTTFDPAFGPPQLLFSFEAVIIGGLGSLRGTLAGGIILGVAHAIGFRIDPGWGFLFGHVVFLIVLAIHPQGLFPKTREA